MRSLMILCALGVATAADARAKESVPRNDAQAAQTRQTEPQKPNDEAGRAMGDIVTAPLQDANIKTKRIPEVLELARGRPYETSGLRNCAAINRNIAALTEVLGADFDTPEDRRPNRGRQAASVGKAVVQSFIPFRGVIREVTGAASAQREWDAAVDAGIARRGFLRGVARMRGCRADG